MTYSFTKLRDETQSDLEDQIRVLKKEIGSIRKMVGKQGSAAFDDARVHALDAYDLLLDKSTDIAHDMRRGARAAGRTARDNPVATIAVAVAVGALLTMLARR